MKSIEIDTLIDLLQSAADNTIAGVPVVVCLNDAGADPLPIREVIADYADEGAEQSGIPFRVRLVAEAD